MIRILFICMGNICRSPAGAAILTYLAKDSLTSVVVDSCGIGDWFVGAPPDQRMVQACAWRGITLQGRAKRFQSEYFETFDYLLAVDQEVLAHLNRLSSDPQQRKKIFLATDFSTQYRGQGIPDPYYQAAFGFDQVIDMLEDSCQGLLLKLDAVNH